MSYSYARVFKAPKTKKEKTAATRQYFVIAIIFGLIACAFFGWDYWRQKKQFELSKVQTQRSKANDELVNDLVRRQKEKNQQTQTQTPTPSPIKETPVEKDFVFSKSLIIIPIILGLISLVNIFMGTLYAVESMRMTETAEG